MQENGVKGWAKERKQKRDGEKLDMKIATLLRMGARIGSAPFSTYVP